MKNPESESENRPILIICEKFKKAKIRCIINVINIDAIKPKNNEKFTIKNSKLLSRKYVSRNVFKSVTSDA